MTDREKALEKINPNMRPSIENRLNRGDQARLEHPKIQGGITHVQDLTKVEQGRLGALRQKLNESFREWGIKKGNLVTLRSLCGDLRETEENLQYLNLALKALQQKGDELKSIIASADLLERQLIAQLALKGRQLIKPDGNPVDASAPKPELSEGEKINRALARMAGAEI